MRQTTITEIVANENEMVEIDFECENYEPENEIENMEEYLKSQSDEIDDFEKKYPELECVDAWGNSVSYRATAATWKKYNFNIEINNQ